LWKFRRYLTFRYLLYAFFGFLLLHIAVAVVETIIYIGKYSGNMEQCSYAFMYYRMAFISGIYLLAILVIAVFLREGNDAYRIKTELLLLAILWFLCLPAYFVYSLLNLGATTDVYSELILLFGLYVSFCIRTISPCLSATRKNLAKQKEITSEQDFIDILANVHFRNCFYEYLKLQFCAEGLLCWEAIATYHALRKTNQVAANRQARTVFEKFIKEGAPFELNIPLSQRHEIQDKLGDFRDFEPSIFREIERTIIHELYLASYAEFLRSPMAKRLIQIEQQ